MTLAKGDPRVSDAPRVSPLYDPKIRAIAVQLLTVVVILAVGYWIWQNTLENLRRQNIASGYGFLNSRAGFDLGQALIEYSSDSSYFQAFKVGLLNTLLVAFVGIITATVIGLLVGLGRLSSNWLVARLATIYVELFRNIPVLLVIFFVYTTVINVLPVPRESILLPFGAILNNRAFSFPVPVFDAGLMEVAVAFLAGIVLSFLFARYARARQMKTGRRPPVLMVSLLLIVGLPALVYLLVGATVTFDVPVAGKFNISGGGTVGPEFLSLYLGLSFYTASFIAEIVRAGIRGVPRGQTEAANALGLRAGLATRLVVLPQALRIIIPPMTSQYLNLTKNSSLAVAIGYADLVAVGGTTLNQTGRAIEVVTIWMVIYLSISLLTSLLMNWFNAKMALVER